MNFETQTQFTSQMEPEVVPETELEPEEIVYNLKKRGRAVPKHWAPTEEKVLTHTWEDVSEYPLIRNNQDYPTFFRKITRCFLNEMNLGDYRKKDQVCSKWWNVNKVVTEFNGVFSSVKWQWHGLNDETILPKALEMYQNKKGRRLIFYMFGTLWNCQKNGMMLTLPKLIRVVLQKESKHPKRHIVNRLMHMSRLTSMNKSLLRFQEPLVPL